MFQTQLICFLQSFSNEMLDNLFIAVTRLGDGDMVRFFLIAVIFGVHFRKGFILLHMVMWTAFATSGLKSFFALPRPYYVDVAVRAIGRNIATPTPLKAMGADAFWDLPDKTAIEYVRQHRMGSFGFPSGHTSGAVALWGGAMVLFQQRWLMLTGALLLILIPFSRMYLGRHFFADILGGYMLGAAVLFIVYQVFRVSVFRRFLFSGYRLFVSRKESVLLIGYLFGLPLLTMAIFPSHPTYPALLLGLNLGFFLVRLKGLPDDSGTVVQRTLRVGVAGFIFLMTDYLFEAILKMMLSLPHSFISYIYPILLMTCFAWAATEANILLGLMRRNN